MPALLAAAAIVLSAVTVAIDGWLGPDWIAGVSWLHGNQPEGARLLLSTIAGSMIGVAGVSFSVTIAAVAYASSQFGPRILTNFMRDRVNQVTLGVFVATFLYCLLVLRTIQTGEGPAGVPHLSVLVGVGFAIASIGVLIQFIHNIADSIHASSAMAAIGSDLHKAVQCIFPEPTGRAAADDVGSREATPVNVQHAVPAAFARHAVPVPATGRGFVQALSVDDLVQVAAARDLIVRVVCRPGDFTVTGRPIAYAWPPDRVDGSAAAAIQRCYAYGLRRTPHQDARLPLDQLVDMAGRALSPGVNDPMTAIGCLHWLGAMLSDMARRAPPGPARFDETGAVRVVASPLLFTDFAEAIFGRLRPYFASDRNACFAMMRVISDVMRDADRDQDRADLLVHAQRLAEGAAAHMAVQSDRDVLAGMLSDVEALAHHAPGPPGLAETPAWMHDQR